MPITPAQCRAARGLVELDQALLAQQANISRNVIVDFEKGRRTPTANNLAAIRAALEAAGVEFTNGKQPGVRLKSWSHGDRVRLRKASERHAATFGIAPGEIVTVQGWRMLPGDPPWGRFSLKLASGRVTEFFETSHFERAI